MSILKKIEEFEKNILSKKTISKKEIKKFIEEIKYARLEEKFSKYNNIKDYNFKDWEIINDYNELNDYLKELEDYYMYWCDAITEKYFVILNENEEDYLEEIGDLKDGFSLIDYENEQNELLKIFYDINKIKDKLYFLRN